uniref:EBP-domain-containing protein n=1 Tax=Steinernema glaseri TaxID=37863 RepID=A0A1I7ZSB3_9BILA
MAVREHKILPLWIEAWLVISTILCALDVIYTMLRPLTVRGGALENVYYFWNIYSDVDLRYADPKDLVTMATGRIMIIELVMNIVALVMARKQSRHTVLTTFTSSAFVFWKTLLYMVLYIRQPEGTPSYIAEDASFMKVFWVFWVADGFWLIVPLGIMVYLWDQLANTASLYPQGRIPLPPQYQEVADEEDSRKEEP